MVRFFRILCSTSRFIYVEYYIRVKDLRTAFDKIRALTDVPFMAVTASAPLDVEATVISSLHLHNPVIVHCDLDRPNISLVVPSRL